MSDNELIERIEALQKRYDDPIDLTLPAAELDYLMDVGLRRLIALAKDGLILQKTLKDLTRLVNWSTVTPMPDKRPVIEAYQELIAAIQRERRTATSPTINVTPQGEQNGAWTVTGSGDDGDDGEQPGIDQIWSMGIEDGEHGE